MNTRVRRLRTGENACKTEASIYRPAGTGWSIGENVWSIVGIGWSARTAACGIMGLDKVAVEWGRAPSIEVRLQLVSMPVALAQMVGPTAAWADLEVVEAAEVVVKHSAPY